MTTHPLFLFARALLPAFCLLALCPVHAHETSTHQPKLYPEKDAHRPTPLPDRVVLTWSGDPATTQAVTWRTDTTVSRALAQLTLATDNALKAQLDITATTQDFTSDLGDAHYHSVEMTGLKPDTRYAYRVGDGVNWSEWHHFRTAKNEAAPFSFVYFGDAQNDIRTHWSRVFREAILEAPRAAFTLHAGDLINRAQRDAEWGEWFAAPAWVNATIPVVPAPGNHEYYNLNAGPANQRLWNTKNGDQVAVTTELKTLRNAEGKTTGYQLTARAADGRPASAQFDAKEEFISVDEGFTALTGYQMTDLAGREADNPPLRDRISDPGTRTLSSHWSRVFTLPRNGPPALAGSVYYFDYQGARIICLNSNERQEEQVAWLRSVLAQNPMRWTIITFHHPIFSPARNRDNPALRALWKPVFDEYKVDLVLTGHDHTYARSGDMKGRERVGTQNLPSGYNQAYDPAIGTVYVVSVSGPKMYDLTADAWAVRAAEDTQLFQIITVSGSTLRFEARTATNRLYDSFELNKVPGLANTLVETLPLETRRKPATAP